MNIALESIIILIQYWAKMGNILGVVYKDGNAKWEEYNVIQDYIYDSYITENTKKKVYIFLTVKTSLNIP